MSLSWANCSLCTHKSGYTGCTVHYVACHHRRRVALLRQCLCPHLQSQCAQRLTRACRGSLSLMQFNVVSFTLDSQLPLPWRRAYKTSCSSLLLPHYNHVWSFVFFSPSLFPLSLFICLSFLKEPWVRDKQTVAPSKDVLPCKQLPLQDKLLLFALQGALISVHQKPEGLAHTWNFRGRHDK